MGAGTGFGGRVVEVFGGWLVSYGWFIAVIQRLTARFGFGGKRTNEDGRMGEGRFSKLERMVGGGGEWGWGDVEMR